MEQEDEREESPDFDRREILVPVVQNIVSALGGLEQIPGEGAIYILGDSCLGCLKDLKKIWRKDDTDDERTVARIFWETRVLQRDLVPILLETAGKGKVEDKCALACADLITAMTWPIDVAEELKELDDEVEGSTDYVTLIEAQRSYKANLLRPGVIAALFAVILPSLAREKGQRSERDSQIINLILHCLRNLAFIRDPPPNPFASGEQAEFASLQSKLIVTLKETSVLDALLTFASNADKPMFNPWNNLLLEIFYLLFRGVKPDHLIQDQQVKAKEDLRILLDSEAKIKREDRKNTGTRHSRFGTTITIKTGDERFVMHRQAALTADTTTVMDLSKNRRTKGAKKLDDLAGVAWLSVSALTALQEAAKDFVRNCFNRFVLSLLKDIRMERPKITEKDNLRLLFVSSWFVEFFRAVRSKESATAWPFTLIKEAIEEDTVKWVLKRMREANDGKPKQWIELQAGIDCLTQLLLLIETMSTAEGPFADAAESLQHKLYYNAEILDIAFENLRGYKQQQGQKSIAYLDSSIQLSFVLLRLLEKWAKANGSSMVVRKKKKVKRKKVKGVTEEEGIVDVPSEEDVEMVQSAEEDNGDSMFTFEAYETRFANPEVNATLLTYLERYEDFTSPEKMKRTVSLLYRQAVKAKAESMFFKVSTLALFQKIVKDEKTLPKDQAYVDLILLIKYVLKRFFKAVAEDSFLLIEAFFPKRASRKKDRVDIKNGGAGPDSSDEDYAIKATESKHGPDIAVKKGFSWSEQVGIAIGCLIEAGQSELVDWVKDILIFVIGRRQRIISDTDDFLNTDDLDEDDPEAPARKRLQGPSGAAIAQFEDYMIPCATAEKADAVTKNAHLKLVFRLLRFFVSDESAEELEWYVPAAILPDELQRSLEVINEFIKNPLNLDGKKASDMINKPRKKARSRAKTGSRADRALKRRGADGAVESGVESAAISSGASDTDEPGQRAKRKRKEKEKLQYKSAQFIEDSDAALSADEAFFAREREIRDRAALAATTGEAGVSNMAAQGTKKRKKPKKASDVPAKKFKSWVADDHSKGTGDSVESDADENSKPKKPRPRPKAKAKKRDTSEGVISTPASQSGSDQAEQDEEEEDRRRRPRTKLRPKKRFGGGETAGNDAPDTSSPGRTSSLGVTSPSPDRMLHEKQEADAEIEDDVPIMTAASQRPRKRLVVDSDDD